MPDKHVCVIGAGAWGPALADLLARKGLCVRVWAFEAETVAEMNDHHSNSVFLPGVALHPGLVATAGLEDAAAGAGAAILAVPSHFLRGVAGRLRGCWSGRGMPELLISAIKGIEEDSLMTMTEVLAQTLGEEARPRLAALSGPSFAAEVASGLPAAVALASRRPRTAGAARDLLMTERFRIYVGDDLKGVELGGALKNVMAVAAGCCRGLELGQSALAALITRGLAEMSRLGAAVGARPLTFMGLSGLGDLTLTCTSQRSRNNTVGLRLGRGERLADILASMRAVAEGVRTASSAWRLSERHGVDMPICRETHRVLHQGVRPDEAMANLLARPARPEDWGLGVTWP